MESAIRNYIIATLIVIAISCVEFFTRSCDFVFIMLPLIMTVIFYPVAVLGMYMFMEAKGSRFINGIDWSRLGETQKKTLTSYVGLFMVIGCIFIAFGILSLSSGNPVGGSVLLILGIIIMLVPFFMKRRFMNRRLITFGRGAKIGTFIVLSILVVAPLMAIGYGESSSEAVSVQIGEEQLVIKAPMVNETFGYALIEGLTYDPDFDKGSRVVGYGTLTVNSGTFHNAAFGDYTLASYTQVKPCVFFQYEGHYYAFNQSDDAKTLAAFEAIKDKIDSIKN